jgi:hypothetical protein
MLVGSCLTQRYSKLLHIYLQTTEGHVTHNVVRLQFLHDRLMHPYLASWAVVFVLYSSNNTR